MGLFKPALRFLIQQHRAAPFRGRVLTLGRQCVYATHDEVTQMMREEGIEPAELSADQTRTNIPAWKNTPHERFMSDVGFFHLLGVTDISALDYSAFESAEIVADLNQPLDESLHGRFDVVIDSGTTEHIFDVARAFANTVELLRVGGRAIHITPTNNFANHGFYQFSPTFFGDFYRANRFSPIEVFVAEETLRGSRTVAFEVFPWDLDRQPTWMTSTKRLLSLCVATKTQSSTAEAIPLQSYYAEIFDGGSPNQPAASDRHWKRLLPTGLKTILRRLVGRSPHKKPWGIPRRKRRLLK